MNAEDFYSLKVQKAKNFGFPEPIFLNTEKLTSRTRVLYIVKIQATHIPGSSGDTHHFALKFSKFKKIKEEPFWEEIDLVKDDGFTIRDKGSIEKLLNYIQANKTLLKIDILNEEYTNALLSNSETTIALLKKIIDSNENTEVLFELFNEKYPNLEEKILAHKLSEKRRKTLDMFKKALPDTKKKERNFWQPFLEKHKWIFGLSYVMQIDEKRIDISNTTDYIFESEDGFVDIVEIKHPHVDFWAKNSDGTYKKYRDNLQISEEVKGSITQAVNYIFQLEKKWGDIDWQRKNNCEAPVKPACTVIVGRSDKWKREEKTAFRLLNDSLHGINIITFDHLYNRGERLLKMLLKD